jgi:tetratricopeptide (TPR) repeat protein
MKKDKAIDLEERHIDLECSICWEAMGNPVLLPCNHKFCFPCLDMHNRSLELEGTCPLCRAELPNNLHQFVYANTSMFLKRANNQPPGSEERLLYISRAKAELRKIPSAYVDSDSLLRLCAGDIHLCAGEFAAARNIYETLIILFRESKTLLDLYIKLSETNISLRKFHDAKLNLRNAMIHCNSSDGVHSRAIFSNFSRCEYEEGNFTQAIEFGESVIQMNRHYEGSYKYVALAYKALGDLDKGRLHYGESLPL